MNRWARGRLPRARDMADTHDLVQETALRRLRTQAFQWRGKGALAPSSPGVDEPDSERDSAVSRRPALEGLDEHAPSHAISPLDAASSMRSGSLRGRFGDPEQGRRELIVGRMELGLTYEQMAQAFHKPSWNAARMAVARALLRLANELKRA